MSLIVRDLHVRYKGASKLALSGIQFQLEQGQCLLIHGPNGSGKSTLLRALVRLFPKGSIGESTGEIHGFEKVGIVFQRPKSQILSFRVDEELATPLSFAGVPRLERFEHLTNKMKLFDMDELRDLDPRYLSSGQQQMLVMLTTIHEQSILLLDEPFSLLDAQNTKLLVDLLFKLKNNGITIIIVDHLRNVLEGLLDQSIYIKDGKQVEYNTPEFTLPPPVLPEHKLVFSTQLTIGYKKPLFSINLSIYHGITLVIGPNGVGKTCLLKTLAGIIPPLDGEYNILSYYYVSQDTVSFFSKPTVAEELGFASESWVQYAHQSPFTLSEGQRRNLALTIALHYANHVILDEPSQGLDRKSMQNLIARLATGDYTSIVIASNDQYFIQQLRPFCSQILEVDD